AGIRASSSARSASVLADSTGPLAFSIRRLGHAGRVSELLGLARSPHRGEILGRYRDAAAGERADHRARQRVDQRAIVAIAAEHPEAAPGSGAAGPAIA